MKRTMSMLVPLLIGTFYLLTVRTGIFAQEAPEGKLVYEWFPPAGEDRFPAVLVLGGSEGGNSYGRNWAKALAGSGIGVMALAYFGVDGLPGQLEEVPVEYFQHALDTLIAFEGVMQEKIAIISVSKGTEAALLLASDNNSIRLVVAASPSHVVWQGINRDDFSSVRSSWTRNGLSLPFLHFDFSRGYYPIINFYLGALEKPVDEAVVIPVERSVARFILFSGSQDQVWPSEFMASAIKRRIESNNPGLQVDCINYPEAGHGFLIPYLAEEDKNQILEAIEPNISFLGGSIGAFEEAMTESNKIVKSALLKLKSE